MDEIQSCDECRYARSSGYYPLTGKFDPIRCRRKGSKLLHKKVAHHKACPLGKKAPGFIFLGDGNEA